MRIDYIFYDRHWKAIECVTERDRPSQHRALMGQCFFWMGLLIRKILLWRKDHTRAAMVTEGNKRAENFCRTDAGNHPTTSSASSFTMLRKRLEIGLPKR